MGQAPMVQLLAVSTTAVCMLLLGTVMLIWTNARTVADAWGIDVPVTVYLRDGVQTEDAQDLATRIATLPEVDRVDTIPPEIAMRRLADGLGGDESLLQGIDPEILPASLEVRLRPDTGGAFASALADKMEDFEEVEEVAVAGDWVSQAQQMLETLGDLALGAAMLVGLACMAIVWSTIRLAVYARRAEIQILRLVGGTGRFVRGPFIVEGCLQGALGAAMALGLLYVGFDHLRPFLEGGLSLLFAAGALRFFTPLEIGIGVAFGAMVGLLGSRAATGRYVET
jgi:cell division transport system permease protein